MGIGEGWEKSLEYFQHSSGVRFTLISRLTATLMLRFEGFPTMSEANVVLAYFRVAMSQLLLLDALGCISL